jgi:hypothetical protein
MTTPQLTIERPGALALPPVAARVRTLFERDALSIVVIATWTSVLALTMPLLVVQDTFLALVDGRLIAKHGLPHVDTLTYWTLGRSWTDQQWGAQLVLYQLAHHGGLVLAAVAGIACVVAALVAAAVATRKLGASSRSAAIGLLLPLIGYSSLTQVRTQSLALAPFVIVFGLLALDARRPGRRVLLVLPLLVLWANLHGSVALAAGLTALYGLTLLRRPAARRRAALLVVGAPLSVLASPYGLDLIGYYRTMLLHPPLAAFVQEWQPPSVEAATAGFFVSAFLLTALWARHQRVLTSFERWALPLLLVAAMTAVRNAVWFELAAAVSFPVLIDAAWPSQISLTQRVRRVNVLLASCAMCVALIVVAVQFARPATSLLQGRSPAAAAAVAAAAGVHGLVLADDADADWLLWQQPSLTGRVAFDVRFELFTRRELEQISGLRLASPTAWERCGATATVVTFEGSDELRLFRQAGVLAPGYRTIARGALFAAVVQPSPAKPCRL